MPTGNISSDSDPAIFRFDLTHDKEIILLLSSSKNLKNNNVKVLRQLVASGMQVILISVTTPYSVIRHIYQKNGIDISRIYIIDAVTKYSGGVACDDLPDCTFISNPGNLTNLGIAITEIFTRIPAEPKCLFFDDVATMLLYSPSVTVTKFMHFVTNKLRILNVGGIFLTVEIGLDPQILAQLCTFADEVITMDNGV